MCARLVFKMNVLPALLSMVLYAAPGDGIPVPTAVDSAEIARRLRQDPLMMPYYTGRILPTPRQAVYRDEFLPMGRVAIVVGSDVKAPEPLVALLSDRIARYGGRDAGDEQPGPQCRSGRFAGRDALRPTGRRRTGDSRKGTGLCPAFTPADGKPLVVLKGRDRLGLLWAVSSFIQLVHWRGARPWRARRTWRTPLYAPAGLHQRQPLRQRARSPHQSGPSARAGGSGAGEAGLHPAVLFRGAGTAVPDPVQVQRAGLPGPVVPEGLERRLAQTGKAGDGTPRDDPQAQGDADPAGVSSGTADSGRCRPIRAKRPAATRSRSRPCCTTPGRSRRRAAISC